MPRRRQDALRCLQDRPRGLQDGARELQERLKLPQESENPSTMDKDISATQPSLNPPEISINWRYGTKAQPSSIRRRSAERRARWRAVQLRPQPILPSIFLHELAYLPSSWQLDGLYTPSLILPLDLRLGAAAASWPMLGACWAHLGRQNCLSRNLQKK